jgi:excisionase family DNA binding protein
MDNSRRLISIKEAAQRLGLSAITIYRWAESGKLPSVKLGGRRLIAEATIEALVVSAMGEGA